jgi:hypothetical protein
MEVCVWRDTGYEATIVAGPSPVEIAAALRGLDGSVRTDLFLRAGDGPWMGFAGGPVGVIVTFSDGPEGPHAEARVEQAAGDETQIRVGGQPITVTPDQLVDIETAVVAAIEFAATMTKPTGLAWRSC